MNFECDWTFCLYSAMLLKTEMKLTQRFWEQSEKLTSQFRYTMALIALYRTHSHQTQNFPMTIFVSLVRKNIDCESKTIHILLYRGKAVSYKIFFNGWIMAENQSGCMWTSFQSHALQRHFGSGKKKLGKFVKLKFILYLKH